MSVNRPEQSASRSDRRARAHRDPSGTVALPGASLASSRLALGTMTFGSQVDETTAAAMVDRALDAGINHVDTANAYNDGAAEEIVGRLLQRLPASRRDGLLLATKVGMTGGLSPRAIRAAAEDSLRRLRTDHLDLYYLHTPDWSTPVEETLEAMADLVRAGLVGQVAVSNYAAWQIAQIRGEAPHRGWPPVHVSQVMYNLLTRDLDDEYAAFADAYAMVNVVYNPLAGGLLTGKHNRRSTPPEGGRFAAERYRERYWNQRQFAAVAELADVAAEAGLSLVELSLRWLLHQPLADIVLLGASSISQLEENLVAFSGPPLDEATLERCDEIWQQLRGPIPRYNR